MIKSLTVRDFQSHQESHLDFVPGVNVIVGDSDSGKSALLRALYWIRENRPTSTEYIRNGSGTEGKRGAKRMGTAEASIEVQRGGHTTTVTRTRGQDVNQYKVDNEPFNALGKDVPAEVTAALKLDKINIQKQIDLPYLILETPGQVAATFNKFTNLDRIDEAIALVSSGLRDRAAKKNEVDEQLATVQAELRGYAHLDEFEKLVEVYEEVRTELDATLSKHTALLECIDAGKQFSADAEKWDEQIKNKQKAFKHAKALIEKVASFDSKIVEVEKSRLALSHVVGAHRGAQARLDEIMLHLPSWQKEMVLQKKLLALGAREEVVESKATLLKDVLDDITDLGTKLQRAECVLTDLHTALSKEKAKLAEIDTCITCGQKLTVGARETMLHNIKHEG